jgi:hemoglobin
MQNKSLREDIQTLEDIQLLVDTFYAEIREDELLGPIFNEIIKDRWPQHLKKMYSFWQTVLTGPHTYQGAPFVPHAKLPVSKLHFDRWLHLWFKTVDAFFEGPVADEAKWRGDKMAAMFLTKIEYLRNSGQYSLI